MGGPVKINMNLKVLQMFDGVSYFGVTLDLGDLELFEEMVVSHLLSEACIGTQQRFIHHNSLAFIFSFHLLAILAHFLQINNFSTQIFGVFL